MKEYTDAIEAKQVAQQDAERAKFVVDQAKETKKSAIIKAQGEAKSIELLGVAARDNPCKTLPSHPSLPRDQKAWFRQGHRHSPQLLHEPSLPPILPSPNEHRRKDFKENLIWIISEKFDFLSRLVIQFS